MRSPLLPFQTHLFRNTDTIEPILNDNKAQHDTNAGFHPQNNQANKINFHHSKTQNVTTNVATADHNNTLIKPYKPSNKIETGDSEQIPSPKDPKIIISPTEVNYHRKVTLKDAAIDTNWHKYKRTIRGHVQGLWWHLFQTLDRYWQNWSSTHVPSTQGQY